MPWDRRQRWPRSWALNFPGSLTSASSPNEVILGNLPLATNSEGTTLSFWYSTLTPTYAVHDIISANGTSDFNISFVVFSDGSNNIQVAHSNATQTASLLMSFTGSSTIAWQKITYEFDSDHGALYHGPTLQVSEQMTGLMPISAMSSLVLNYHRTFAGRISDLVLYNESFSEDRIARDFPWNVRTGQRGIEQEALYYWPFDEGARAVSSSNSKYLHELMQNNNATITGGSIKMVNSSHPLIPRYNLILLTPTTAPTSKYHIPSFPASYHQVINVTKININRKSASMLDPLSVGELTFVVDDNLNKYRTGVDSWMRPNRAIICRAEYCGSDHILFAGEITKVSDQWQPFTGFGETGYVRKTITCRDALSSLLATYRYDVSSVNTSYQLTTFNVPYVVFNSSIEDPLNRTPKSTAVLGPYDPISQEDNLKAYGFEKYDSALSVIQGGIEYSNLLAWIGPAQFTPIPNALIVRPFSYAEFGTAVATISEFKVLSSEESYQKVINYIDIDVRPIIRVLPGSSGGASNPIYIPASTQVHVSYEILDHQYGGGRAAAGDSHAASSLTLTTHWTTNANSDGTGADRSATTSFETAQTNFYKGGYFVKNTHATNNMWLTKFVPPTYVLIEESKQLLSKQNTVSQNSYGLQQLRVNNNQHFRDYVLASSKATYIMSRHHSPIRTVNAYLENYFGYCLKANAGDLVNIVNSATNNVNKFFITSIEHDIHIGSGVLVHGISFTAENHQLTGGGGGPIPPPPPPPPSSLAGFGEWDAYASSGYSATPVSSHWARIMSLVTTSWFVDNTAELNTAAAAAIGGTVIYCRAGLYNGTINLNTNGTSSEPIVVRAQSLGTWGARLITWEAKVNAGGNYLKVGGIKYTWNPGSTGAFHFEGISPELLDCDFVDSVLPFDTSRLILLSSGVTDSWIHHNYISNNKAILLPFDPSTTTIAPFRPIVEYNNFENSPSANGGNNCVQLGQFTNGGQTDIHVVISASIRYNRFMNLNAATGEIKTSNVNFYRNYSYNSVHMSIRAGKKSTYNNNYFKQCYRPVRIWGDNHNIVNNVFDNCTGDGSVNVFEGSTELQCNSNYPNANHVHVQSLLIAHNMFYLCQSTSILIGTKTQGAKTRREPYSPAYIWIYNNIFRLTQGMAINLRNPDTTNTTVTDSYSITYFAYQNYHQLDIRNNNFYLTGTAISGRSSGAGRIAWDDATRTTSTTITGTTSANPLLSATYRITSGSPCANAGVAFNKNGWNTSSQYDWDGNERLQGAAPDQGQYEIA